MVSHFISYTPGKNGNASQHNHINPKLILKKKIKGFLGLVMSYLMKQSSAVIWLQREKLVWC